jgi:hypothetical protein
MLQGSRHEAVIATDQIKGIEPFAPGGIAGPIQRPATGG